MADPLSWRDIPAWLALATSMGIAIRQGFINRRLAKERKEFEEKNTVQNINQLRRMRAEQLVKELDELSTLAVGYWVQSGSVISTEGIIISMKTRAISSSCYEYRDFLWPSAASDFSAIKMKITGGNFQVKSREAYLPSSPFIRDCTTALSGFREKLQRACDKLDEIHTKTPSN
ncbi:hypothetical protein QN382_03445 [Pseudomonas sp. 10B1]|uniref:hypothetical protein n=1 Tax=Pseudomonas sp. 10B1 TaxID=3048573 RepID=UPI002B238536|nr:hypothetical protein [Pseudomonas sp. 10B1]MEB0308339.1 hypothetical protein [Pseudomonas sp. 10B1]